MNILQASGPHPVGAVALLGHADPAELARFNALEEAVWSDTCLPPAVIESVRLRCAHLRRCASCSAVRITAATEDGLSEGDIALIDRPETRTALGPAQRAAIALAERFLLDPRAPEPAEADGMVAALGSRGVIEVLLACGVFASSELRIALGEDRAPDGNIVVERERRTVPERPPANGWPALEGPVLDPSPGLPLVSAALSAPLAGLLEIVWSGSVLEPELVGKCVLRSSQLLGVTDDDPVSRLLAPPGAALTADPQDLRQWPAWPPGLDRDVLALAERLWIDPASVDRSVTDPLAAEIGVAGVIRATWALIWIAQLQRLALVLHRGR